MSNDLIFFLVVVAIVVTWIVKFRKRPQRRANHGPFRARNDFRGRGRSGGHATPGSDQGNAEQRRAGERGEALVREELMRLKGQVINGHFATGNMVVDRQNFELDFLIMVPNFGLVLAEVKFYAGQVYCSGGEQWKQVKPGTSDVLPRNASRQVLRSRALLKKLLASHGLDRWQIKPVVVFSNPGATIYAAKGAHAPQTDVIRLDMLEKWIRALPRAEGVRFSRQEAGVIKQLLGGHSRQYDPGMAG